MDGDPNARKRRVLIRAGLVAGYWLAQGLLVMVAPRVISDGVTLDVVLESFRDPEYLMLMGAWALILTIAQGLMLLPARRPFPARSRGWDVRLSLAMGALAGAGLIIGAGGVAHAILELCGIEISGLEPGVLLLLLAGVWACLTPVIWAFCLRSKLPKDSLLARTAAILFTGTLLETACTIPVDVMIRRRHDCYCDSGTFLSLVLCASVGTFSLGPGVLFALMARRRKRYLMGYCDACGYDMRNLPRADRCPECGAGWKPAEPGSEPRA
ncbi:MAG: hypothetical protein JNM07_12440 [Phycisphaerae bacterium]|nr:hypothetical protein [Phycisphaerae bacterium]